MRYLRKRRAFIAAPLVGTMIFLISLMLIIAINRAESARVDEIVSQAYHNRLVSLVEIFRSDLGSNFNLGLQNTIEYGLTSQCWFNLANLRTEASYSDALGTVIYPVEVDFDGSGGVPVNADTLWLDNYFPPGDDRLSEAEERYHVCRRFKNIIRQVVCPSVTGMQGLPQWVSTFSQTVSFEGIHFEIANVDSIDQFQVPPSGGAGSTCYQLVQSSTFDCRNFAIKGTDPASSHDERFKCCEIGSQNSLTGDCTDADSDGSVDYLPTGSCTNGNFMVPIDIVNLNVFQYLPRIQATDNAGNIIRAGAIADESFQASVNYPLFKYLDAAFIFNRYFAYGPSGTKPSNNQPVATGINRGVLFGACDGNGDHANYGCDTLSKFSGMPNPLNFRVNTDANADAIKAQTIEAFYKPTGMLQTACGAVAANPYNLDTRFCIGSTSADGCMDITSQNPNLYFIAPNHPDLKECTDFAGVTVANLGVFSAFPSYIDTQFQIISDLCGSHGSNPQYCADIERMSRGVLFFDQQSENWVDAFVPNTFCWFSGVSFDPP